MSKLDERLVSFDFDILWDSYSDTKCEIVALTEREIAIILSCIRVGKWVARWFTENTPLRQAGRMADAQRGVEYVEQLERKLLMSGCLDGLLAVLGDIRDAIRSQAACCQSSINSVRLIDIGDGELVYGTEQPLEPPTSFGGDGEFEDEADYNEHKCKAANNIVAGLVLSLNSWSTISLVSLLAGGLVIAFFVANPPIGVIYALAVAGFLFGGFLELSNYIDDNRFAWVCAIYNSDSYSDFLTAIDEKVDDMVVELDIGIFSIPITELIHSVLDTDTFNKMFTPIGLPEVQSPVDCTQCGSTDITWQYEVNCGVNTIGATVSFDGTDLEVQSGEGDWGCNPAIPFNGIVMQSITPSVDISSLTLSQSIDFYNVGTTWSPVYAQPPSSFTNVSQIAFYKWGTTQFTATMSLVAA